MADITIRLTPRKIERAVFIAIILVLGYFTYHFYAKSCETAGTAETAEETETTAAEETPAEETTTDETANETAADEDEETATQPAAPIRTFSGGVTARVNKIEHSIKNAERGQAVIDKIYFYIKNDRNASIKPKVNIHIYNEGDPDEVKAIVKKTVIFPVIGEGVTLNKAYVGGTDFVLYMWDFSLKKYLVFDFYDQDNKIIGNVTETITVSSS